MRIARRTLFYSLLILTIGGTSFAQIIRNYKPYIVGQNPLSVEQGQSITIQFSDLIVLDLDDIYPSGFYMKLKGGKNYSVIGTTVTPDPDYFGELTVPVIVNDGKDDSNEYKLRITVHKAPNVPPTITGQSTLTITQGESITLKLDHLQVEDPDDEYPKGFTLLVESGQNYTVSGTTVTPIPSFTGTLIVEVSVNDGESQSQPFDLQITVKPKNVAPIIVNQTSLTTSYDTPVTILLTHLIVNDPDNEFPDDFTLKVLPGSNYRVSGTTVTPASGFSGELTVGVTVNDGEAESAVFNFKITVFPPNVAPVITGQVAVSTNEETALTIALAHLKVTDPDDKYPDNFTLKVFSGSNYSVNGNTITPITNYTGTLQVGVQVNDGEANSNTYNLQVTVVPVNDPPEITGQVALSMNEDTNLTLLLSHITVSDVDNTFPKDFSLKVLPGTNYSAAGNTVTPTRNFTGNLQVSIIVNDGHENSNPFNVNITVHPLSDPPEIVNMETLPGTYQIGKGPVHVSQKLEVIDPDGDKITYAEVGFAENNYRYGRDVLIYNNSESSLIDGIFDANRGLMVLFGTASAADYTEAIRSIEYNYIKTEGTTVTDSVKTVYFYVKDGESQSETKTRAITMISRIELDIPNCFTPNGDDVNDTWQIKVTNTSDEYKDALIRVYNIRGLVVYEATGLDKAWDGKLEGTTLPSDTYYFTINLNLTYTRATYKGIVTILY